MHKVNLTTPDKVILVEVYQVDVPPPFSIKLPRKWSAAPHPDLSADT